MELLTLIVLILTGIDLAEGSGSTPPESPIEDDGGFVVRKSPIG